MNITITLIDSACMLLNLGGFRILTDPVLDPPGSFYHFGFGSASRKYSTPAFTAESLGPVDLVLLSHDHHHDNLDKNGRRYISTAKRIVSTKPAAKRIPGVIGLENWQSTEITDPRIPGSKLRITAVPAQHTSLKILNPLAGKVIGFVLEWQGQKGGYYISGDTVYFKGIEEIATRFPKIDVAFLHTGSAGFPYITGFVHYTFTADEAVRAVHTLKPRTMIPIHFSGWWHFRESQQVARRTYEMSDVGNSIRWLTAGITEVISSTGESV